MTAFIEFYSSNLFGYSISRFIFGSSRAAITVANGIIFDTIKSPKDRTTAVGRNFSALGLGFLLGSALGGFFLNYGYQITNSINLFISIIGLIWVYSFIEESKSDEKQKQTLFSTFEILWKNQNIRNLFAYHIALTIALSAPTHAYLEFMRVQLQLSAFNRGLSFIAIGLTSAISQSNFTLFSDYIGSKNFLIISLIISSLASFIAPLGGFLIFIMSTLIGTVFGCITSLTLSAVSKESPQAVSGTVSGLHESFTNLSLVIGGLICPPLTSIHLFTPFWVTGIVLIILIFQIPLLLSNSTKNKDN